MQGGAYVGTSESGDEAMSLFDLSVAPNSFLEFEVTLSTESLGGVVFDSYDDGTFKFAGILGDTNQVVIGHVGKSGNVVYDAVADITFSLPTKGEYTMRVSLQGSVVTVSLLGGNGNNLTWYDILGHAFNAVAVDGQAGVLSMGGTTSFDSFTIRTDDPAFLSIGEELVAPSLSLETDVPELEADSIAPVLEEAIRRITKEFALSVEQQAALALVEVSIVDLPGLVLARNNGYEIELDVNAAGHGWFLDPTPASDEEFDASGKALAGSDAEGDIDLLTALMHELGHVLGFDHGDAAIMADSLATGERILDIAAKDPHSDHIDHGPVVIERGALNSLVTPYWLQQAMHRDHLRSIDTLDVRRAGAILEHRHAEHRPLSESYRDWWILDDPFRFL